MKKIDIMPVDRFQDKYSMEFKDTPEEFAKEIERMKIIIKNEIKKSKEKLEQGLTNMCNHDILVMGEQKKFYNSSENESKGIKHQFELGSTHDESSKKHFLPIDAPVT